MNFVNAHTHAHAWNSFPSQVKNPADRAAENQRQDMKRKRRELEQVSLDAASDMLDTDSNATFAMVSGTRSWLY